MYLYSHNRCTVADNDGIHALPVARQGTATLEQSGILSKRLSHQRELLHPLLGQHKTSHRKSGGVPFRLPHERKLLPGEQRLRQTSRH
jgi:hypothetical protein